MTDQKMPTPNDLDSWKVDFTWKSFKGIITDARTNDHIMDVDCKHLTNPLVKFINPSKDLIGTASFNAVSIHAECEIRGRHKKIQAMKRMATEYTYLSDAFAHGDSPVPMYWTSSTGFKHWDFILLNSNQEPMARFRSSLWAVTKLGFLEFMGDYSAEIKEEILITGFSVYYNTLWRANNFFQLFGAIGGKVGPIETDTDSTTSTKDIQLEDRPVHNPNVGASTGIAPMESSKNAMVR
jgi:hypothetical protein